MKVTYAQLAAHVSKSERTIQRRIAAGTLEARRADDGGYEVWGKLAEKIAADVSIDERLRDLSERLDRLEASHARIEQGISEIQQGIDAIAAMLSTAPIKQIAPHEQASVTSPNDLPEDTLTVAEMARELGISRSTLVGHCTRGTLEHESRPLQSRPGEHARFFTPAQAEAARIWHQAHSKKA